nr:immunoglobulin light chain junction region [Macaca mulatta]MOX17469.1 immunoglobulin light chain junction region [Macaca mulatta]MOX17917.1 immunoglobulin light chain junction region [Macaca mulatta]MOX18104.1 immunoglobulin light chain junction region [Macaca mulatta]MOX18142.1 immunoglobulin light chain junction region [Macaca mulatta]
EYYCWLKYTGGNWVF